MKKVAPRLPDAFSIFNSRAFEFLSRIEADPSSLSSWPSVLSDLRALQSPPPDSDPTIARMRDLFDSLITKFTYSPRHWLIYIELESSLENHARIANLFSRCFRTIPSFDLYRVYLSYIRARNSNNDDPVARDILGQAYKYVLSHVEHDIDAGGVFYDYIAFLKAAQVHSPFEEHRKIEEIRSVYQRAVCLPLHNVKILWRDWDTFENGVSRDKAKGILSERSSSYLAACNALRVLKGMLSNVEKLTNVNYPPTLKPHDRSQYAAWRNIIQFEKSNPLRLRDSVLVFSRVSYTYWLAIHSFPRLPELWYEFAMYTSRTAEKPAEVKQILSFSVQMCPGSFLLNFALCDLLEASNEIEKCKESYERLIAYWEAQYAVSELSPSNSPTVKQTKNETELKNTGLPRDSQKTTVDTSTVHGATTESARQFSFNLKYDTILSIEQIKHCLALSWITLMKFSARAVGIPELRAVFKRVRTKKYCSWYIPVASALMEFYRNKNEAVTKNIFKYAIDTFSNEPEAVLAFSDWLLGINDQVNFTSVVLKASSSTTMPREGHRALWDKLGSYHSLASTSQALKEHDTELRTRFPDLTDVELACRRYSFFQLDLVAPVDLDCPSLLEKNPSATVLGGITTVGKVFSKELGDFQQQQHQSSLENNTGHGMLGIKPGNLGPTTISAPGKGSNLCTALPLAGGASFQNSNSFSADATKAFSTPFGAANNNSCSKGGSGANNMALSMASGKRRVLDEWVVPSHLPLPDVTTGRCWQFFRLPKMTDEEQNHITHISRQMFDVPQIKLPVHDHGLSAVDPSLQVNGRPSASSSLPGRRTTVTSSSTNSSNSNLSFGPGSMVANQIYGMQSTNNGKSAISNTLTSPAIQNNGYQSQNNTGGLGGNIQNINSLGNIGTGQLSRGLGQGRQNVRGSQPLPASLPPAPAQASLPPTPSLPYHASPHGQISGQSGTQQHPGQKVLTTQNYQSSVQNQMLLPPVQQSKQLNTMHGHMPSISPQHHALIKPMSAPSTHQYASQLQNMADMPLQAQGMQNYKKPMSMNDPLCTANSHPQMQTQQSQCIGADGGGNNLFSGQIFADPNRDDKMIALLLSLAQGLPPSSQYNGPHYDANALLQTISRSVKTTPFPQQQPSKGSEQPQSHPASKGNNTGMNSIVNNSPEARDLRRRKRFNDGSRSSGYVGGMRDSTGGGNGSGGGKRYRN